MRRLVLAAAFLLGLPAIAAAQADADAAAIRRLLGDTFGHAGAPLALEPVVVEGDAALVGWTQGEQAGRAFLRQAGGRWVVVACAGDALRDAATLQRLGLPEAQAARLAAQLAAREAALDPRLVARFASFGGLMEIGPQGHGR